MEIFEGNSGLLYKICLVGDGGVGKTALLERYLGKKFRTTYQVTIGTEISVHSLKIDGQEIKLQIWDLAGQPRFEFVRAVFYRGSHAVIMIFDQTRSVTLINLLTWKEEIVKNVGYDIPIAIMRNKSDLEDKNQIDEELLSAIMEDFKREYSFHELPFFVTSALTGQNVTETFEAISRLILKYNPGQIYRVLKRTQRISYF